MESLIERGERAMILYIVHGDTWYDSSYGYIETIFGIFTDKYKAEAAKKLIIEELYEKEMQKQWSNVCDISDINVEIVEIEADRITNIKLGEYIE